MKGPPHLRKQAGGMADPGKGNDVSDRTCLVEGCSKPTRSDSAELCKMHYHRQYRHGSVERVATRISTRANQSKYRIAEDPTHPLAGKCGKVYVHRRVLYALIGPGAHPCYWCGHVVQWELGTFDPDVLQVDHLNTIRDDNRPENLVVACRNCNTGRGSQFRAESLRNAGWWSEHDTVARLRSGRRVAPVVINRAAG